MKAHQACEMLVWAIKNKRAKFLSDMWKNQEIFALDLQVLRWEQKVRNYNNARSGWECVVVGGKQIVLV